MQSWIFLLSSFLVASGCFAQSAVLTCATSAVPAQVRAEGIAERTGDIVLSCSGGQPGAQVAGNIIVSLSVNVTNRILSNGTLDSTLIVDNGSAAVSIPARQSAINALAFNGVVFNTSAQGKAELRIVNIRGNASQLGFLPDRFITAAVSFTGAGFVVPSSTFIVALPLRGLLASSTGRIVCGPGGSPLPEVLTVTNLVAAGTIFATTRATEGFASAFAPISDPASFRADSGVRVIARYSGFPSDARLFVPDAIAGSSADVPTSAGEIGLAASGGQYTAGRNQLLLIRVTGADATGAGGRLVIPPPAGTTNFNGVGELPVAAGSAYAVYEVVDANPFVRESAQVPAFLGLPRNANRIVETGASVNFAATSNAITQSSTAWIPRFVESEPPGDCSALNDCGANYFPRMQLDTTPIRISAAAGQPATRYIPIRNAGAGVLRWNASIAYGAQGANWLRLDTPQGVNNGTIRLDAVTAGLAPGVYQATLSIDGGPFGGVATIPVVLTVTQSGQNVVAMPAVRSVANAASSEQAALVAGSLATIMGSRLSGGAVEVTFDGTPATLLYQSEGQINLVVPMALTALRSASMVVSVDGRASAATVVSLSAAAPAIFFGAVLNEDDEANSESRPASAGETIQVFATGLPAAGAITAKIHDLAVPAPAYGGPAPGLEGVQQVNIVVPAGLPAMQTFVFVCGGETADRQVCGAPRKVWLSGR